MKKLLLITFVLLIGCEKEKEVLVEYNESFKVNIDFINLQTNIIFNDTVLVEYIVHSNHNINKIVISRQNIAREDTTIIIKDTIFYGVIKIIAENYNTINYKIEVINNINCIKSFEFIMNVIPRNITNLIEYENIILATYEYSGYDAIVANNCYAVSENKTYFSQSNESAYNSQNIDLVYARGKLYSPKKFKTYYSQGSHINPQLSINHWYYFNNTKLVGGVLISDEFDLIENDSLLIIKDNINSEINENGFVTHDLNNNDIILFKTVEEKIGVIKVLERKNPENVLINGYLQYTTGYIKLHIKIQP